MSTGSSTRATSTRTTGTRTAGTDAAPLWPDRYETPDDLPAIEAVPLSDRDLPASTYAALAAAAERWPNRPALTTLPSAAAWRDGLTRTYAELRDDVDRIASVLHGHGVRRTTTVGLLSPNTVFLPAALLAAQAVGIAAPINPALAAEDIVRLLETSGARVLVAAGPELDPSVWDKAREVASRLGAAALLALRPTGASGTGPDLAPLGPTTVAYLDTAPTAPTPHTAPASPEATAVHAHVPVLPVPVPPTNRDLAAVFHTGGTTGSPKLAAHTHANEITDAWCLAANSALDQDATLFAALPLFHVNALVVTVLAPMLRGQHVVWAGPAGYREPELYGEIWKIIEHHRIATLSAVPTVYSILSQVAVDADISSLSFAVVGASALPTAVREAFTGHTGVELCEGYGLTEATCVTARSFVGDDRHVGAVGQRLPYQHVKTVRIDEDGSWHDLPAGTPGVLAVHGPTVFPGYVTGHTAAGPLLDHLGTVRDGWLDTGDTGRVDADGFIHLTGRAKDLIIRGGHNLDPAVIEDALLAHPAVSAACAVGRPDAHAGEVPVVYVTLAPGALATPGELLAYAAACIHEPAAVPKAVTILDALPLTDVGKPTKVPLRLAALREAVMAELAEADKDFDAPDTSAAPDTVHCRIQDGRPTVTVPAPRTEQSRERIRTALDRYTFDWAFAPAPDPSSSTSSTSSSSTPCS